MQVFLLGMHRSGTSAVARVLNLMGCYFGIEDAGIPANAENPKGFWERRDVRQLNDSILRNVQCDWDRVAAFDPSAIGDGERAIYRDVIADVVLNLDAHRPWFIKEPRCCLTFDLWRECLEVPVSILVIRNPLDVTRSLERRNGIPPEVGFALWEAYNVAALNASRGVPRAVISYEKLMAEPTLVVRRVRDLLGGEGYLLREPEAAELSAFLDADLRHFNSGRTGRKGRKAVPAAQAALYDLLRAAEDGENALSDAKHTMAAASVERLKAYEETSPSASRRAEEANAVLIRGQRVETSTELALKRLELQNALDAAGRANKEAQRWRSELESVKVRNASLLSEASASRREHAAESDRQRKELETLKARNATLLSEASASRREHAAELQRQKSELEAVKTRNATLLGDASVSRRENAAETRRWRVEVDGLKARNMALLTEASTNRREIAALGDEALELRGRIERMVREVAGTEETLRRKDRELLAANETLRDVTREMADLQVKSRGLLATVDVKDRDLVFASDALAELERELMDARRRHAGELLEQRRIGEALRESLNAKDRELEQALEEIGVLTGERTRLESAARTHRTRVAELRALMDETLDNVELLLQSRRWRLGHAALSLPHQLIGRPRPRTVADYLRTLRNDERVTRSERQSVDSQRAVRVTADPAPVEAQPDLRSRKQITVLVLAWDVGHNPLGRAYLVAEALARSYTVVLAGFQFPRYGDAVWKPLRDAAFRTVSIPGESFPAFQHTVERLARRIDADVIVACKARLPAVQAALMCKAFENRPVLIDVDDYELSFFDSREPLADLSGVEPSALVEPFEEAWTRFTETLLPAADGLLVSNAELQRRFGGSIVPHARDERVFDPAGVDRDAARRTLGLGTDLRIVLFVGTPRPHKGIVEVLEAVESTGRDDVRFVVVGTPPDKAFEDVLRNRGGDSLVLLPDQPFDRLAEVTAVADLICLLQDPASEIARYQLPAKVVDAIAMGIPVLATDVPPLAELIESGAVEAATSETLPDQIRAWLAAEADARAAQAERARSDFLRDYSYEAIHRTLYNEIERCLQAPKALSAQAGGFLADQARRYAPVNGVANDGLDVVMFWKQGDVGLYGRRFDMLVQELSRRDEIRRIAVFDAPFSVYHVLRDHEQDSTVHHRDVAESKLLRRWGLADQGKVTHHVFLFDNHRALAADRYPHMSKFADFVDKELDGVGIDPAKAVFWYYPVLEEFDSLRKRFQPRLKVVDVVDDQRTWPDRSDEDVSEMTRHYRAIVADADVVLANCETVRDAMSGYGRDVALVPNGCDTDAPPSEPDSRAYLRFCDLPRPVLGLVGNLEGKTDLALLERLARERSAYQIVLIGSTHAHAETLRLDECPNVHFFGIVKYPEVKAWVKHFDVALLPHMDTDQTRSMHPLKMLVYATAGVPIVSTRIENLGDFEPFISVAGDHDEFLKCVDAIVAGQTDLDRTELSNVVARNAWSRRCDDIMALISRALGSAE